MLLEKGVLRDSVDCRGLTAFPDPRAPRAKEDPKDRRGPKGPRVTLEDPGCQACRDFEATPDSPESQARTGCLARGACLVLTGNQVNRAYRARRDFQAWLDFLALREIRARAAQTAGLVLRGRRVPGVM